MSDDNTYFVHTDDWAMIEITPVENQEHIEQAFANRDQTEAETHPSLPQSITTRQLTVADLDRRFGDLLETADQLLTGYTTDLEPVTDGFAYYDDDLGAIYGTHQNGSIQTLYYDNRACNCGIDFSDVMAAMTVFGQEQRLLLVDWFLDILVNLAQDNAFQHYVEEE